METVNYCAAGCVHHVPGGCAASTRDEAGYMTFPEGSCFENDIKLSSDIAGGWALACREPSVTRWRALAYTIGFVADDILAADPYSTVGDDLRTLSHVAFQHVLDLQEA